MEPRLRAPALETDGKGFVSDADRDKIFHLLRSQPENRFCFDCAGRNNTWISATFGIFLCMTCSGQHRNLGARISFVRSTDLDRIKLDELLRMELGGNARARTFFRSHGVPEGRPTDYRSKICERYRKALDKELAETMEKYRPDLSVPWRAQSPTAGAISSTIEFPDEVAGPPAGSQGTIETSPRTNDYVSNAATTAPTIVAGVGYESGAGAPYARGYVVDRSGASKSAGGHFASSASTKPAMKVQTDDFDFDFDSAFQSAPKTTAKPNQVSRPGSLVERSEPQNKKSAHGFIMSPTETILEEERTHGQSPSIATAPSNSGVRKDLSSAKAISAQDFEANDDPKNRNCSSADYTRFKSANAISSDAFFGGNDESNKPTFEDEAATRLGIYHDKAVQKAADIAMAAQETFKSAAGWFNRVAQSSNSGTGF